MVTRVRSDDAPLWHDKRLFNLLRPQPRPQPFYFFSSPGFVASRMVSSRACFPLVQLFHGLGLDSPNDIWSGRKPVHTYAKEAAYLLQYVIVVLVRPSLCHEQSQVPIAKRVSVSYLHLLLVFLGRVISNIEEVSISMPLVAKPILITWKSH